MDDWSCIEKAIFAVLLTITMVTGFWLVWAFLAGICFINYTPPFIPSQDLASHRSEEDVCVQGSVNAIHVAGVLSSIVSLTYILVLLFFIPVGLRARREATNEDRDF